MQRHEEIDIPDVGEPLLQECLTFLDGLRGSGIVNMFGATPHLMAMFPQLTKPEARQVVTFWIVTYSTIEREADRVFWVGRPPTIVGSITS